VREHTPAAPQLEQAHTVNLIMMLAQVKFAIKALWCSETGPLIFFAVWTRTENGKETESSALCFQG
jgi:hypothetical protein